MVKAAFQPYPELFPEISAQGTLTGKSVIGSSWVTCFALAPGGGVERSGSQESQWYEELRMKLVWELKDISTFTRTKSETTLDSTARQMNSDSVEGPFLSCTNWLPGSRPFR